MTILPAASPLPLFAAGTAHSSRASVVPGILLVKNPFVAIRRYQSVPSQHGRFTCELERAEIGVQGSFFSFFFFFFFFLVWEGIRAILPVTPRCPADVCTFSHKTDTGPINCLCCPPPLVRGRFLRLFASLPAGI